MGRMAQQALAVLAILLAWFGTNASAAPSTPQTTAGTAPVGRFQEYAREANLGGFMLGSAHAYLKCAACHAQGRAPEEICLFCHTGGGPASQVYGGSGEIYRGMDREHQAHEARHGGTAYQGCLSCHEPHGKSVIPGSALLRDDPAAYVVSGAPVAVGGGAGFGGIIPPATNQRDFCLDCHGGLIRYGAQGSMPLSQQEYRQVFAECASCHASREHFGVDADTLSGGPSHVMTSEPGTGVAWRPSALPAEGPVKQSNSCTLCHDGTLDFPHSTEGESLLEGYGSGRDEFCAGCHTDTGSFATATEGVGITY
ncbi:MAG: cytochrome c3 family protein [Thermoleophilia bacterium]